MSTSASSSRSSSVATTGRRPTNSGIRPNFSRSSGSTSFRISPVLRSSGPRTSAPKPIEVPLPRWAMIFSSPEKAPPQMNRMLVVSTCRNSCCGMLAPALRRHRGDGAFHDLQQRLLHALARHVAGDRGVVGFAGDLVDLVDIDDAALRPLDIVVGGLQQLQDDVLDILADIAGLGQRRRVGHREGHVDDARQRLRQQRLARAGRADQQDVRLRELDVVVLGAMGQALVVVVHGDRQHALGVVLADHVIVEHLADVARRRHAVARLDQRRLVLLTDDVHAELDAFVADEDGRTGNQLPHLVLALAAEGAVERVLRVAAAGLGHRHSVDMPDPSRGHVRARAKSRTTKFCARLRAYCSEFYGPINNRVNRRRQAPTSPAPAGLAGPARLATTSSIRPNSLASLGDRTCRAPSPPRSPSERWPVCLT